MAQPPSRGQSTQQPRRAMSLTRCIAFFFLTLIILTALTVLIVWLTVRPRKLHYSIEHASITSFNLTKDNHLYANFDFVLRAKNPNKRISLYYDKVDATVSYEDMMLASENYVVEPFYQRRRNVKLLDMSFRSNGVRVYGASAKDLRMDRKVGDVALDLNIRAKIRLKVGVFKVHRTLKVACESVKVPVDDDRLSSSTTKGFDRVSCDVDID